MGTYRCKRDEALFQAASYKLPRARDPRSEAVLLRPTWRPVRRRGKVERVKKSGILNPALCQLLARTGHTDYFTISDRGFPVPDGPDRIDLSLVDNIPTVLDVLGAIAQEYQIDRIVITNEMREVSPQRVEDLKAIVGPD